MAIADKGQNIAVIEKYITKEPTQFTLEDAAAKTGLPILETEDAIKALMGKYESKLRVTENGDLIYDFGQKLQRRHQKPLKEYFSDIVGFLWKVFQVFYKFLTAAFLVIYFMVFIVIIIGLALTGRGSNNAGHLLKSVFRAFLSIFQWKTILGFNQRYYRNDRYGYRYQHYKERPGILETWRKNKKKDPKDKKAFVASIYDFIFGPPRVQLNPLANNQEVASFLRENKGLITTSEIQALAGWKREEAENFMTECLAYFDGKADISDQATLYGDFSQLLRSKDNKDGTPVIWYWDEYEPAHELTGNSKERDSIILFMNSFNIGFSIYILGGFLMGTIFEPLLGFWAYLLLGYIPLVYSLSFFTIPFLRWLGIRKKQKQQHKENIRKRLMKIVFQTDSNLIPLSVLTKVANEKRTTEEKLKPSAVDEIMKDTIIDLGGEGFVNNRGEIIYKFELLGQELQDIQELRQHKKDDSDLGKVIFEA